MAEKEALGDFKVLVMGSCADEQPRRRSALRPNTEQHIGGRIELMAQGET
jgi:hypothetical protein